MTGEALNVNGSGVVQHLNQLATLLSGSNRDWSDRLYTVKVYNSLTTTIAYARSGNSLVYATTGRASDVAAQLGPLAWVFDAAPQSGSAFEGYIIPAQRLLERGEAVSPDRSNGA